MPKGIHVYLTDDEGNVLPDNEIIEQLPSYVVGKFYKKAKVVIYGLAILIFAVSSYLLLLSSLDFYTALPFVIGGIVVELLLWFLDSRFRTAIHYWIETEQEALQVVLENLNDNKVIGSIFFSTEKTNEQE